MFALIDCNNFYASCERLFRPDLQNKPIVVLSNNDGCVIARSNEAKAFGIKMGEPYFQMQGIIKQHQIQVFSSNYTLYGDLSERVMRVIESSWAEVEVYSIDEAFIDLTSMPTILHDTFCKDLQKRILQLTGIPTSIGIGVTKTLAKLANHIAKRELKIPVFNITEHRYWLNQVAIGDVWGIGRQWRKKLSSLGINTAGDLASQNAHIIKKHYSVVMMRTVMELQGIVCAGLEEATPKKAIMSSKSFGQMQTEFSGLCQALSSHCARACEKARSQHLVAKRIYVFIRGNPHRQDLKQYAKSMQCQLVNPTDDTRVITAVAKRCLQQLFIDGIHYKKIGVMLEDLVDKSQLQYDLFNQHSDERLEKKDKLMKLMDGINGRFGSHTVKLAAEGTSQPWKMRSEMLSPRYTTSWAELPIVKS